MILAMIVFKLLIFLRRVSSSRVNISKGPIYIFIVDVDSHVDIYFLVPIDSPEPQGHGKINILILSVIGFELLLFS